MYGKVLVPTDGSKIAERAGKYAVSIAEQFIAELHIICVETADIDGDGEGATSTIAEFASDAGFDPVTTVVPPEGSVHGTIIDYAEDHDIGAIVMGTHGRTGVNRFLLGSVAEQTLRESPIPVVTVHEDTDIEFDVDHILVPTDGSEGADAAADHAIDLATDTDATLHVVHVAETTTPVRSAGWSQAEENRQSPVGEITDRAATAGIENVETDTLRGKPHLAIVGYATEHGIDCIVMGTHGRTGLRRYLLGSVTERIVRFSPVPVISVKAPRVTTTVEYLDFEVLENEGWSLEDTDLFEKAATADLDEESYGTMDVDQGEYILEAAEADGHDWPFHCRSGACVNCVAVLVDGEIEMEMHRGISEGEIEDENLRLTCVGTPTTEHVKLVYNAKYLDSLRKRVI